MIVKDDAKKEEEEKLKKENLLWEDFNLEKFLKDNQISDCIKKLQKEDILDSRLFFKVDIAQLETVLDIKPEGKKHKVMKKIKELREKYEKEGKIQYLDMGLLEGSEGPNIN